MFGKEQPEVVTDDDVCNCQKLIPREGVQEIETYIIGGDDGVVNSSGEPTNRTEDPK